MYQNDRNERNSLIFRILSSKLFFIIILAISIYFFVNIYHQIEKRVAIKREIKGLEKEINDLQSENTKISELIKYFQTDEYIESSSREKLGYKKPGEKVIVFSKENGSLDSSNTKNKKELNAKLWWNYFFNK